LPGRFSGLVGQVPVSPPDDQGMDIDYDRAGMPVSEDDPRAFLALIYVNANEGHSDL
jgi:hypothetical protein